MTARGVTWFGLAAALLAPSVASGQGAPETLAFSWVRGEGADGCPPASAVMVAVRTRLGRDPFDPEAPLSAESSVARVEGRWRARLVFRDPSGAVLLRRDLEDASEGCETITTAVALSVSLGLAPQGSTRPVRSPPPTPAVDPEPLPRETNPSGPRPEPAGPTPRWTRVSAGAELLWGPLPRAAPGATVRVESAWSPRWSAAVSVGFQPERRTEAPDDVWAFGMTRATLGLCARTSPRARLELSGCAALSAGLVHGVSFGPQPVAPGNYPWAAARVELRAAVRVVGPVRVMAELSPGWAFARNRFVALGRVDPVHAQAGWAFAAGLAVGVER